MDLSSDSDPIFLTEFYKNLKILSQDLYKKSATIASQGDAPPLTGGGGGTSPSTFQRQNSTKRGMTSRASFRNVGKSTSSLNLLNDAISAAVLATGDSEANSVTRTHSGTSDAANVDYFSPESLNERMRAYAKEGGGIPIEFVERYSKSGNNSGV